MTRALSKKRPTLSRTGCGAMTEYPLATGRSTQSSSLRLKVNIGSLKPDNGSGVTAWLSPGGGLELGVWLSAGVANETTASRDDASIIQRAPVLSICFEPDLICLSTAVSRYDLPLRVPFRTQGI